MSCPDFLTLSVYADHELESEEAFVVETHLKECAVCRDEVESMHRLNQLGQSALNDIPVNLNKPEITRLTGVARLWVGWAVAALFFLSLSLLILQMSPGKRLENHLPDTTGSRTPGGTPDAFSNQTF